MRKKAGPSSKLVSSLEEAEKMTSQSEAVVFGKTLNLKVTCVSLECLEILLKKTCLCFTYFVLRNYVSRFQYYFCFDNFD